MRFLALVAAGVPLACVGYGIMEARLYRTITHRVPLLRRGSPPIRILQISDLHLRDRNRRLASFVESLGSETYELVLATGDLLGEPAGVEPCAEALNRLQARFGRYFVLGSSDYYAPQLKNYLDYFLGKRRLGTKPNRTREFRKRLLHDGWIDLSNRTVLTEVHGVSTQITGLDDPYLGRDDRSVLVREPSVDLALCVTHDPAPYRDAAHNGFDLIVAGHTHGGQVRLPFVGALVTNSKLPRRLARGLAQVNGAWLHVTPGLGTGKYAPFRFLCPPEASVLELVERDRL